MKRDNMDYSSFFGVFSYFGKLIGKRLYLFMAYNVLVGLTDGIGLILFIPLLYLTIGVENTMPLGNLNLLPQLLSELGISLNLLNTLILLVLIFTLKGILLYLRNLFFIDLRLKAIKKVRYNLISGLERLSYRGYTLADPGKIQYNMVGESSRFILTLNNFIRIVQSTIVFLTYIGIAIYTNFQFSMLVIIGATCSNLIYGFINKRMKHESKQISGYGNLFNNYLIQAVQNFKYLKSTGTFKKYEQNLKDAIDKFEMSNFRIGLLNGIATSLREPLVIFIIAIMLYVQIEYLGGEGEGILASILLFYRGLTELMDLQNYRNSFLGESASVSAIENLKTELRSHQEPIQQQVQEDFQISSVRTQDLHVSFGNVNVLNNISIEILPKQTVALVGESGAGKTTLANVISGLIEPDNGIIECNNQSLDRTLLNQYRSKIGYISQEPVIFDDSIYNNVTFWAPKTEENIRKFEHCLKLVHLQSFVDNLVDGLDTELGNNGILISGGQKQRVSIARELFRDVDLLIMDEATSALDSETENIIKENIDSLHGQYMMVIIAHRLSTIKNADVIYVIKQGRIIEKGSYQELYEETTGEFHKMVGLQGLS